MKRPHLHTIPGGGSGRRSADSSGGADARAIVVDDDELRGGWVAVDIDRLPFVPVPRSRMRLAWRARGLAEGRLAAQFQLPPPEPAETAACPAEPPCKAATRIPPDRIVRVGRQVVPSRRARAWAEAARQRQQELDAAAGSAQPGPGVSGAEDRRQDDAAAAPSSSQLERA
ncbi:MULTISPECIES: hypothetical protein [unclassified Chelatococcus]|uniref:hypothetical protein n=1 Tax=unclassified Chelatococcus TaxID=2638111 RepID=UPI001BD125FE|nr:MULTISPECIES: hypothetical protein [unclassified Chelatococcus]MBS7698258.1 hypothetical protein [Chelatococcus sp. YT9]MBX3560041.1 hypothetical protein [Chelatococcus sp.]